MIQARRSEVMPYRTNQELPDSVKDNLPNHAQAIYREAFDSAWDEYADPSKRRGAESREEVAHKVAWAAVKKKYEKVGEEWKPKD
jgi:cation transport regulator